MILLGVNKNSIIVYQVLINLFYLFITYAFCVLEQVSLSNYVTQILECLFTLKSRKPKFKVIVCKLIGWIIWLLGQGIPEEKEDMKSLRKPVYFVLLLSDLVTDKNGLHPSILLALLLSTEVVIGDHIDTQKVWFTYVPTRFAYISEGSLANSRRVK